jgi:glutamate-ammonia-ligase adenylyltransferase
LLDDRQAAALAHAHAHLLQRALACTLDLRSRITPRDASLQHLCDGVREITHALGFGFAPGNGPVASSG